MDNLTQSTIARDCGRTAVLRGTADPAAHQPQVSPAEPGRHLQTVARHS